MIPRLPSFMPTRWVGTPLRLAVPVVAPVSGLSPWVSVTHRSASTTTSRLAPSPLPHTHNPRPRPRTPPPPSPPPSLLPHRPSSSSASSRWKLRQSSDPFARSARVQGLKSRAAFKLLELDAKYHLFRRGKGQVVVDLGYAPGSWSQVAADRTAPNGTVVGIDIIPAQPPRGVSTIQGNFLDPGVQGMVKGFLLDGERRRVAERAKRREERKSEGGVVEGDEGEGGDEVADRPSYIDLERMAAHESEVEGGGVSSASEAAAATPSDPAAPSHDDGGAGNTITGKEEKPNLRLVDVVLSDMMMNTSGITFKDHAGSMDLCHAALTFASETLKPNGHFVCKFYQGAEDKAFESLLRKMFAKVHREKPESSRSESREAFFVALRRKGEVTLAEIEGAQV